MGPGPNYRPRWPARPEQARPWRGSCRSPWRPCSGAEKEGERGPGEPLAHQEVAGGGSLAGGAPMAVESMAAAAVSCRETATAAATPGTSDQFLGWGGQEGGGGASQLVGGGWGGAERCS
jgi:hypothetical protein